MVTFAASTLPSAGGKTSEKKSAGEESSANIHDAGKDTLP